MADVSIILARATNGVIGNNNTIPWYVPGDLKRFKEITMGHAVIMGRKTYDSIGKPLPGRTNIVITRQADWGHEGVTVVHSLQEALDLAAPVPTPPGPQQEIFIIGGGEIYEQALPYATKLYLTDVHQDVEGDTFAPEFFGRGILWLLTEDTPVKNDAGEWVASYRNYKRILTVIEGSPYE